MNKKWIITALILILVYKIDFSAHISKILSTIYPVIISLLFAWFLIPAKKKTECFIRNINNKFIQKHAGVISAFAIYILFVGTIAFFFIYLIPIIKEGIVSGYDKLSAYYGMIEKYVNRDTVTNLINPNLYIAGAKSTITVIFKSIMSFVVLIYVLIEHRELKSLFINLTELVLGEDRSEKLIYYFRRINIIFIKYFYSKFISSLLLGIMVITGFLILGISYPVFFGIIVALSNMIPIFGAFISGIPIALTALSEYGIGKTLIVIGVIVAGQQIENSILTPKIVGNSIGISSFWILFTVIVGGGLFGFFGMLVCIPVAATIKMFYQEFLKYKINKPDC